ncbi:SigB/SigF/SigG family RNA polymerase sigma factor [Streptomyces marincola]|uniref:B/F/G family RNA polymerase sigma-70 factor n=1 Tax=Streptomyces marincola TaxID=2878388 RepID=A0A1W7CXC9_9ACTN|nr:SigB/SigF/SigG family RNA polymerase sigma factor [Streptomyces marincola]ARQ69463.1 B/F/G family RNA polymerase sigma-70 factor [Streptomyces marincola]
MRTSTRTAPRTNAPRTNAPRTNVPGASHRPRPAGPPRRGRRHPHDDAPDTSRQFERLAALPEGPERARLRDEVVRAWLPMAERLARTYGDRGESQEDLAQVAALGLVKAVRGFDPARGCAFESYAVPTIVGEVRRHFRDHLWGVHVPRRTQELRNRVRAAHRALDHRVDDRPPGVEALAEASGLTPAEVRDGMAALDSYRPLSLDAELGRGGDGTFTLADTIGASDAGYERVTRREAVRPKLRELPERERKILYLRFYRELTQREIGERLGLSQMHVSRLLNRACERIHDEVEADGRVSSHS